MKVDLRNINFDLDANTGDIILISHKGMGDTELFLITKSDDAYVGLPLDGSGNLLLHGEYFTISGLLEDLRTEPLIEKIMVLKKEDYKITIEKV
jgi:hypothetical protein